MEPIKLSKDKGPLDSVYKSAAVGLVVLSTAFLLSSPKISTLRSERSGKQDKSQQVFSIQTARNATPVTKQIRWPKSVLDEVLDIEQLRVIDLLISGEQGQPQAPFEMTGKRARLTVVVPANFETDNSGVAHYETYNCDHDLLSMEIPMKDGDMEFIVSFTDNTSPKKAKRVMDALGRRVNGIFSGVEYFTDNAGNPTDSVRAVWAFHATKK